MIERHSLEETLAELERILDGYRRGVSAPGAPDTLTLEAAVARLMKLRFTTGEALRLLRPTSTK